MAIKGLPEKHKSKQSFGLRGREPWAVTEAGLYRLVMRSNKPEAAEFQDWVTDTVLPAIRRDGAYVMGEEKVATGEATLEELTLRVIGALQAKVAHFQSQAEGMDPNEARVMTVPEFRAAYQIHSRYGAELGRIVSGMTDATGAPPVFKEAIFVDNRGATHITRHRVHPLSALLRAARSLGLLPASAD